MSPIDSSAKDRIPRVKANVYTAMAILASIFLVGGIVLLYLTIEPYTQPPRRIGVPTTPGFPSGPSEAAPAPDSGPAEPSEPAPGPGAP
jgi:hypothetical protein